MNDDPLDDELRQAVDDANVVIEREFATKTWWDAVRSTSAIWWRMSVHMGPLIDSYRKSRLTLRRAIRGLRRAVKQSAE